MVPENNPVNEEKYLGNRENDNCIYGKGSSKFIYPIITLGDKHLRIVKISLVDFHGDTIYKCLELQQIIQKTDIHYVVLAYRHDKKIDIYYTKGFDVSEDKDLDDCFSLLAPIGNTSETPDKFPLIYLKKVVMVKQKGTEIFVRIDGKDLKPLKLIPYVILKRFIWRDTFIPLILKS